MFLNRWKNPDLIETIDEIVNEPFLNELKEAEDTEENGNAKDAENIKNFENEKNVENTGNASSYKKNKRLAFLKNEMAIVLLVGIIIYFLIGEIIILVFTKKLLYNSIGLFLGILLAVIMLISMTISVENAIMYNDENKANAYLRNTTLFRLIFCFLFLFLFSFTRICNIIALLFGIMSLKLSAYISPIVWLKIRRR